MSLTALLRHALLVSIHAQRRQVMSRRDRASADRRTDRHTDGTDFTMIHSTADSGGNNTRPRTIRFFFKSW